MNEQEKHAASQEERKEKIRARYKGVDRSELEFIPAKQKEKLFEDAGTKRVCAYCRVSTDDANQTSSYELQKNHYEDMIKEHAGWTLVGIYADEGISGTSLQHAIKWGTIRDGRWAVLPKSCKGFSEPLYELMGWNKDCKYKLRGQFCGTADEQVMIFELEEPEVLVREKAEEQFAEETEKKPEDAQKPIKKILYPEAWAYNFGESTNRTVFLQRVAYRGNWDILRPARTVEGMEIITREVLDDLLESAEKLIDKMRCANYA